MNSRIEKLLFNISKYRTQLMGMAAFGVLAHHIFTELYTSVSIPIVTQIFARGNIGVDIFLIVSGMGLFVSITKKDNLIEFYSRRVIKVIVPWLLMSIPYWVFMYYWQKNTDFLSLLKNLLGISFWTDGISTTWYVQFIIVMYLIYPFIYKIQKNNSAYINLIIIIAIFMNFLLYLIFPLWYVKVDKALTRIPAFIMGSILGEALFAKERKNECEKKIIIYTMMTSIIFGLSPVVRKIDHELGIMFYFFGAFGIAFIIMLLLSWLLADRNWKVLNGILCFIGKMSLEVYLLNVFIRNIIVELNIGMKAANNLKICIMIFTSFFILIVSFIWSRINNKVSSAIEGKLKK